MAGQPQGLNGLNPLSYMGVNPGTPPNLKTYNRAPTVNDSNNFLIGSIWLFPQATTPATSLVWMLTALVGGQATWQMITFDGADEFVTDAGTAIPAGGILNVLGGPNINTSAAGNTVDINLNTSITQPATTADGSEGMYSLGASDRFMYAYGPTNTFLGVNAGNLTLTVGSALDNTGIGGAALTSLTTAAGCTAIGAASQTSNNTSNDNVSLGAASLRSITGGAGENTIIGTNAANNLTLGSNNLILGFDSGSAYTTTESSNILIGNVGSILEDNTIRIGTQGVGAGQQNATQVAGIYAAPIGTINQVTLVDSTGFLGSSRGDDGQILIGQTGGTGSPAWANITSTDASVGIINGANSIDLSVSGGGGISANPFFAYQGANAANVTGHAVLYQLGSSVALTTSYDFSGGFNPGNGAGTPASFTAPVAGYYVLFMTILYNMPDTSQQEGELFFGNATGVGAPAWHIWTGNPGSVATPTGAPPYQLEVNGSAQIVMTMGQVITFCTTFGAAGTAQNVQINGNGVSIFQTYVSGYRIA